MIEKPFNEIVGNDSALCLYLHLTAYAIEKKKLSKKIGNQIEKIISEDKKLVNLYEEIKSIASDTCSHSVEEFLWVYPFALEIINPIRDLIFHLTITGKAKKERTHPELLRYIRERGDTSWNVRTKWMNKR